MLYRIVSAVTAVLLVHPLVVFAQNGDGFHPGRATYLWPTNASNYLSSTFAETRSEHFHAALDLKTWGRRGYKVYATRDGLLHRIAIGPKGYGKVVYLKHDDGSYSIYAHLLRFEDRIQQMADSIRMRDYSFELDRTLDSLGIRIDQGDLIGLSGASGIGPPHLHFELRTPFERPFNPLLTNLRVDDNIPPRFSSLSVEPLSMFSSIEGDHELYTRRAQKRGSSYTFQTIDTRGAIGLGVDVFDQADRVYNPYAVYELKMYVDGQLFFHSRADSFAYNETNQMFLDRVYPILKKTRKGYQRLYIADGNTLPFYRKTGYSGKLDLEEGVHEIRITAGDFYGNTSSALLRLRVQPVNRISHPAPKRPDQNKLSDFHTDHWKWFDNWVNIPDTTVEGLTIAPLGSVTVPSLVVADNQSVNVDLTQTRDLFFRRNYRNHFVARRVNPEEFSIVPATTHNVFAAFDASTFYDTLSVGITTQKYKPDSIRVSVHPENQPIRKPYLLAYELDSTLSAVPNLAFYEYNERRNRLSHLETHKKGSYLIAHPESMGSFYALSDTTSPVVNNPGIKRRPDGHWIATLNVHDNLSGIDHTKSVFIVNGIRGIAEFEPEDDRLVYYHPSFKPLNINNLEVEVTDRSGNVLKKTFRLDGEL